MILLTSLLPLVKSHLINRTTIESCKVIINKMANKKSVFDLLTLTVNAVDLVLPPPIILAIIIMIKLMAMIMTTLKIYSFTFTGHKLGQ